MKKNSLFLVGIDVGNYDTKSPHTTTPSGYEGPYTEKQLLAQECLYLGGKYYVVTNERLYYMADKTQDERCLVLTLISIAKEILYRIQKETPDNAEIQERISRIDRIALGAGLPIAHYRKNDVQKLSAYYRKHMENGIDFDFNGYHFCFTLAAVQIYPQGGAAAASIGSSILNDYRTYYIFDIGGYTLDIAQFVEGKPQKDMHSLELGIITLYDSIIDKIYKDFDMNIDYSLIEDVLSDRPHVLPENVVEVITDMTNRHATKIISALRQSKIAFTSYPSIFVGGGSIVLKKYILNNSQIRKDIVHFVSDTRANAKGYTKMLRQSLANKGV